ncbi:uncharacterized protein LOC110179115 isoform X2 [Drosophila serrata]|uniref:uncharacterized protein LOC110179115 isoform X2 n=1 Tax=Drosophila serrata TaxID=7274 RepID=UPI000A1CFC72|nr:uncharacterized protein LOC110179115 isoform X2 [Drosophila serrata]
MWQPEGICKRCDMELLARSLVGLGLWILALMAVSQGTNFEVIGDEKTMDIYCSAEEDQGDISFREFVDVSGLTFDVADDLETLFYNGDIKMLMDVPQGPITMQSLRALASDSQKYSQGAVEMSTHQRSHLHPDQCKQPFVCKEHAQYGYSR